MLLPFRQCWPDSPQRLLCCNTVLDSFRGCFQTTSNRVLLSAALAAACFFCVRHRLHSRFHSRFQSRIRRRHVFVIGADSGFGYSTCWYLHEAGCSVIAGCLTPDGRGATRLRERGVAVVPVDVTQPRSIQQAVEQVETLLAESESTLDDIQDISDRVRLSSVIYNAGVLVMGRLPWLTEQQIAHMVSVNLTGALLAARACVPLLERRPTELAQGQRRGRMILVSSSCGLLPCQELAPYSATKAGILAAAQALRLDLASRLIDVCVLLPGDMIGSTGILARQSQNLDEMWSAMSDERRQVEQKDFEEFRKRFQGLQPLQEPVIQTTPRLKRAVLAAVFDKRPLRVYTALEAGSLAFLRATYWLPQGFVEWLLYRHFHYTAHSLDADWLDLNRML